MKLLLSYLLFFCLGISNALFAQRPELRFQNYNSEQGLSGGIVYAMAMDYQGFMWFCTTDGLNKFDGYTYTLYKNNRRDSTSLVGNDCRDIVQDLHKQLWVATNDGLDIYDRNKNNFKHIMKGPSHSLLLDKKGNVWVIVENTVCSINSYDFTFFKYSNLKNEYADFIITDLVEDKKGDIWVASNRGIRKVDQVNRILINQEKIYNGYIPSLYVDDDQVMWMATRGDGLIRYMISSGTCIFYKSDDSNINSVSTNVILSIQDDNRGLLWVGTENNGINVFDRKKNIFYRYTEDGSSESMENQSVYTIYKDDRGGMWVGTYNAGIKLLKKNKFRHFKSAPGVNNLSNNNVIDFAEDKSGNVWVATDGGGLNKFDVSNFQFGSFKHSDSDQNTIPNDHVTALLIDKNENLWVGTWEGGVDVFNKKGKKIRQYRTNSKEPNSLVSQGVKIIFEDKRANIWIGTAWGLSVLDSRTGKFKNFQKTDSGLPNPCITALYEDAEHNLWIGTWNGLAIYNRDTGTFVRYLSTNRSEKVLSNGRIFSIIQDAKGRLWVGTNKGLNLFDKKNNTFSSFDDRLLDETIFGMVEDKNGFLWLSTHKGISRLNPDTRALKKFDKGDGVQEKTFHIGSSTITKSGHILFGGGSGFNYFHPDDILENKLVPEVAITDFKIFNKSVQPGLNSVLKNHITQTKAIELSYQQTVFSFDFAALSYFSSDKNQYAYKMEGIDKEWTYIDNRRSAIYTYLDPGSYTFRVKASNNDGVWNEEGASIDIVITPPFWQTWWFRTLVALLIAGSAVSFYKARMRSIQAQKARLEKLVQERTTEVVEQKEKLQVQAEHLQLVNTELKEQREEIEVQRDNMERINAQMMSSIQYAHTIQQAILPSQRRISQRFPQHFILYRPKDVVSGDFYWFAHLDARETGLGADLSFMAVVDCTGHGVPGAFMSIIGSTLLNEIVKLKHILDPARILEELSEGVRSAVEKSDSVNTAGMDVCLLRLQRGESDQLQLQYAGAKRPLLWVSPGGQQVETLAGDRHSIGSEPSTQTRFTTQELLLEKGTSLYLTSDGYTDQNNPERLKIGSPRLRELIMKAVGLPVAQQRIMFEQALLEHQRDAHQRDDITLVGIVL